MCIDDYYHVVRNGEIEQAGEKWWERYMGRERERG